MYTSVHVVIVCTLFGVLADVVIVCTIFGALAGVLNQSYREARAPRFSGVVFGDKSSKY